MAKQRADVFGVPYPLPYGSLGASIFCKEAFLTGGKEVSCLRYKSHGGEHCGLLTHYYYEFHSGMIICLGDEPVRWEDKR